MDYINKMNYLYVSRREVVLVRFLYDNSAGQDAGRRDPFYVKGISLSLHSGVSW